MRSDEGRCVEARDVDVAGGVRVVEEVRGDGEVARAGEAVGEAVWGGGKGVSGWWVEGQGGDEQSVLEELDAKNVAEVDDGSVGVGLAADRPGFGLGDVEADWRR